MDLKRLLWIWNYFIHIFYRQQVRVNGLNYVHQNPVEEDLVLDPFCASGTTGIVSNSIGRRFVGVDVVLI